MNRFVRMVSSVVCVAFVFSVLPVQSVFALNDTFIEEGARLIRTEDGSFAVNYSISDDRVSENIRGLLKSSVLEPSFDLRDEGRATPVRNQYSYGTCWAFGTIASLESGMITSGAANETVDLSERHLAYFTYKGADNSTDKSLYAGKDTYTYSGDLYNMGGSNWQAIATLSRCYGAVSESEAPYASYMPSLSDSLRTNSRIRIKNVTLLPETTKIEYNNRGGIAKQELLPESQRNEAIKRIKETIAEKGAVAVSYYASDATSGSVKDDPYWNSANNSYYFNGKYGYKRANHEVTIVGWDDNYSKSNFNFTPPGNGAWIIKNSWGSSWGDDGYFYMSYYDISFSEPAFFEAEDIDYSEENETHEYENVYQYDGVNFGDAVYLSSSAISSANVFTARKNEIVQAISTVTLYSGCTFTYQIYKNLKSTSNPESGILMAQGSEYFEDAGYYTIDLDKAFAVEKGDTISVVIQMSVDIDGETEYIIMHEYSGDYTSTDISAGQSFFKQSGTWKDASKNRVSMGLWDTISFGNAVVKIFTADWSGIAASDITYGDSLSKSVINGNSYSYGSKTYAGSYQWEEPEFVPNAGTGIYTAVFTPENSDEGPFYVDVMVNVQRREVTYQMLSYTRFAGEENPEFEAKLISGSLVDGDEIYIEARCEADEDSPPGTYKITGTADEDNYAVTIKDGILTVKKVAVTSVKPSASKISLLVGAKKKLSVKITPTNATFKSVLWSSSNKSVAKVNKGTITAVGAGTATITATADGKKASIKVTVNPAKPSGLKLLSKKGKLTVKYQKGKGAAGTQIYIVSGKNSKIVKNKKTTKKSYTVNLAKGKYKVKVRAYKNIKGKYYYSPYTKYKTIEVK